MVPLSSSEYLIPLRRWWWWCRLLFQQLPPNQFTIKVVDQLHKVSVRETTLDKLILGEVSIPVLIQLEDDVFGNGFLLLIHGILLRVLGFWGGTPRGLGW